MRRQWETRRKRVPKAIKTVRDMVERFRISYPVTQLLEMDKVLRDYMLWRLLKFLYENNIPLKIPTNLTLDRLTDEQYRKLGMDLERDSKE